MKQQKGFSLIELMVVVAIIGILVGIALPSYQSSVQKSNRKAKGMPELLTMMQAQENYFTTRYTYTDDLTKLNYPDPYVTPDGHYAITISECLGNPGLTACVLLTATALGAQAQDGNLSLDSRGNKRFNGNEGWPR